LSAAETKVLTRRIGVITPFDLAAYRADGGYAALEKALSAGRDAVTQEVKRSGLLGRGGAGFPTGLKWEMTAREGAEPKYLLCNADEGELGTHKDRLLLGGDPCRVLEGMTIAAYAAGAAKGIIYFNEEFRALAEQWERLIRQAEEEGLLGEDIMGSGFGLTVKTCLGRGLYIAGEEMALISSLEGKRPTSRPKPPFPTQAGLFGLPTCINNVETLANVPDIVWRGADWFLSMGLPDDPGTRLVSLSGDVKEQCVCEIAVGSCTLAEAVPAFAGGTRGGRPVRAVQPGGGTSAFLAGGALDTPIASRPIAEAGSSLGTAGVTVYEEGHSLVDAVVSIMEYYGRESCGRCAPCRIGTVRMLEILKLIQAGAGKPEHLEQLRRIGRACVLGSTCGMGEAFPQPVLSALKLFPEEFESRLVGASRAVR